jgi:hypothetical protein
MTKIEEIIVKDIRDFLLLFEKLEEAARKMTDEMSAWSIALAESIRSGRAMTRDDVCKVESFSYRYKLYHGELELAGAHVRLLYGVCSVAGLTVPGLTESEKKLLEKICKTEMPYGFFAVGKNGELETKYSDLLELIEVHSRRRANGVNLTDYQNGFMEQYKAVSSD